MPTAGEGTGEDFGAFRVLRDGVVVGDGARAGDDGRITVDQRILLSDNAEAGPQFVGQRIKASSAPSVPPTSSICPSISETDGTARPLPSVRRRRIGARPAAVVAAVPPLATARHQSRPGCPIHIVGGIARDPADVFRTT